MERAQFHHMKDGTQQDWTLIASEFKAYAQHLPERIVEHLNILKGDCGGFPVDRYTHCLQTATLAHKDGKDDEYVVCALLHDIGDTLGSYNHSELAATILEPFVSAANHWMIKHHGIFQGYYFFHYLGMDRDMYKQYESSPYYAQTREFVEKYDSPAFDPEGETYPIEFFMPMIEKVFAAPRQSLYSKAMDQV